MEHINQLNQLIKTNKETDMNKFSELKNNEAFISQIASIVNQYACENETKCILAFQTWDNEDRGLRDEVVLYYCGEDMSKEDYNNLENIIHKTYSGAYPVCYINDYLYEQFDLEELAENEYDNIIIINLKSEIKTVTILNKEESEENAERILDKEALDIMAERIKDEDGVICNYELPAQFVVSHGKRAVITQQDIFNPNINYELFFDEETGLPNLLRVMVYTDRDLENPYLIDYKLSNPIGSRYLD